MTATRELDDLLADKQRLVLLCSCIDWNEQVIVRWYSQKADLGCHAPLRSSCDSLYPWGIGGSGPLSCVQWLETRGRIFQGLAKQWILNWSWYWGCTSGPLWPQDVRHSVILNYTGASKEEISDRPPAGVMVKADKYKEACFASYKWTLSTREGCREKAVPEN